MRKSLPALLALALASGLPAHHGHAQTAQGEAAAPAALLPASLTRGAETNLPLPRFVSLKSDEGNARRGPSLTHRIDWVFRRRDMPLLVTAEFENWRRVEDSDGQGGWIHYTLLSGVRTVVVESALAELTARPDEAAEVNARAEAGVIGRLGDCVPEWCRVSAGGEAGWVRKTDIWGVGAGELRD
ncbi:MAG: SH3 domain-containing protein [Paracoccaceae bacterium]